MIKFLIKKIKKVKDSKILRTSILALTLFGVSKYGRINPNKNPNLQHQQFINRNVNKNVEKSLQSTLDIRAGDLNKNKFSAGSKARGAAKKNFNKQKFTIISGAEALTPSAQYTKYNRGSRSSESPFTGSKSFDSVTNLKMSENQNKVTGDKIQNPSSDKMKLSSKVQAKVQKKRSTSLPNTIQSSHQTSKVTITNRNVVKWSAADLVENNLSTRFLNKKVAAQKFIAVVEKPNEVIDGILIHNKNCKVYIKDTENVDGTIEKLAVIVDAKSGSTYLGSKLTESEYNNLKSTGNIDLFDLRRNPQTLVMDKKSIIEVNLIKEAQKDKILKSITDIRRPYNITESNKYFVRKNSDGDKIHIDVKSINNEGFGEFSKQTSDINLSAKKLFSEAEDPSKVIVICDLSELPSHLQRTAIQNITRDLEYDNLKYLDFVF